MPGTLSSPEILAPDPAPPARLGDWPLPRFRYVPGRQPHPLRHPDGHAVDTPPAYRDAGPWVLLQRGMDLFDHRYWWESHEVWEQAWRAVPRDGAASALLQGLIQVAASLLQRHRGAADQGDRLHRRALRWLEAAEARGGSSVLGVDLPALRARVALAWDAAEPVALTGLDQDRGENSEIWALDRER